MKRCWRHVRDFEKSRVLVASHSSAIVRPRFGWQRSAALISKQDYILPQSHCHRHRLSSHTRDYHLSASHRNILLDPQRSMSSLVPNEQSIRAVLVLGCCLCFVCTRHGAKRHVSLHQLGDDKGKRCARYCLFETRRLGRVSFTLDPRAMSCVSCSGRVEAYRCWLCD